MKAENRNQLVRGYVVVSSNQDKGPATKDGPGGITAYTFWYRHDDNLNILENDLAALVNFYSCKPACHSILMAYEYKDYEH